MKNTTKILTFLLTLTSASALANSDSPDTNSAKQAEEKNCEAPVWAKAIGHEQKWKLHNGCPVDEEQKDQK